jgi:hypothetical protein
MNRTPILILLVLLTAGCIEVTVTKHVDTPPEPTPGLLENALNNAPEEAPIQDTLVLPVEEAAPPPTVEPPPRPHVEVRKAPNPQREEQLPPLKRAPPIKIGEDGEQK